MAMVVKGYEYEIPCIYVYYSSMLEDTSKFDEILWGIEEEGIPYDVKKIDCNDSEELSHLSSIKSKLAVGIGISKEGKINLTFNKLPKNKPLFTAYLDDNSNILRDLGCNGGRLVKGIAFK